MAVTLVNPSGLPEIPIYRQVSVATGSKLIHVAGQVSWDEQGAPVGDGDLAAQVEQCYLNVGTALAGVAVRHRGARRAGAPRWGSTARISGASGPRSP
ncbi:hypothetical protein ACTI_00210 [Actinoplanes sp. OR16]|nr:hypothetical protein ACTI_00210 [Actinoplanes sp. OR16]